MFENNNLIIIENVLENEYEDVLMDTLNKLKESKENNVSIYCPHSISSENIFDLARQEIKISMILKNTQKYTVSLFINNNLRTAPKALILFLTNEEEKNNQSLIEQAAIVGFHPIIITKSSKVKYRDIKYKKIRYKKGFINKLKNF